jgi:hypothetical protein
MRRPRQLARLAPLRCRLDFLQRVGNRRHPGSCGTPSESYVGNLVELVELLHDHLAHLARENLALASSTCCAIRSTAWSTYSVGTGRLWRARWKTVADAIDVEVGARYFA